MSREADDLAWLDLLRVMAATAVVVLHIAAEPVVFVRDHDSPLWNAGNILDSLSRWCIGVFIMVSGALLLDPSKTDSVGAFYTRRLRRILVPTLFWSVAYLLLSPMLGVHMTLPKAADLLWTGRPWYHMWYLFMIIGLYLYEYLSPNVILMSLAVFALASRTTRFDTAHADKPRFPAIFVKWAAPLTLGVYLWHPLLILGLRKLGLNAIDTGSIFGVFYVAVPTLVISLALTWAMSRVPLLRQTVGLR